jgi:hypothetical protein
MKDVNKKPHVQSLKGTRADTKSRVSEQENTASEQHFRFSVMRIMMMMFWVLAPCNFVCRCQILGDIATYL